MSKTKKKEVSKGVDSEKEEDLIKKLEKKKAEKKKAKVKKKA